MKEYIEREQAIALFYPVDPENDGSDGCTIVYKSGNFSSSEIETMLSDLPAVDVAEVRHGRWVFDHMTGEWSYYSHCSECNYQEFFANEDVEKRHKYCLNCGARMGKEANHGN